MSPHRRSDQIEGNPVPSTGLPRLAVLIDAEFVTANFARPMLDRLTAYGAVTIRRAYGDWSSPQLTGWTYKLETHAITPVQRFAGSAGRSSAVSAIIIDALDLVHSGRVDGIALVCNDGSFTPLATRLREGGAIVVGLGRSVTPPAFVAACDDYVDLDTLSVDEKESPAQSPAQSRDRSPAPVVAPSLGQPSLAQPAPSQPSPAHPRTPAAPAAGTRAPQVPPAPELAVDRMSDRMSDRLSDTLPSQRRDPQPAYTGKHRA